MNKYKTLKNDTRYIIKKVIIGVLIAIVLFNARKCGVYALTYESYLSTPNTTGAQFQFSSSDLTEQQCRSDNPFNSSWIRYVTFEYNDVKYNICYATSSTNYGWTNPSPFVIAYLYNNDIYISYGDYLSSNLSFTNMNLVSNNISYDNVFTFTAYPVFQGQTSPLKLLKLTGATITNNNKILLDSTTLLNNDNYKNLEVIYNSTPYDLTINTDYNVPPVSTFPPSGYSELDLTGYQGVIFVPKNYSTMDYNQLYNLDFNYYYKGRVRDGYFLLNNSNQHYYDTDILISDEDYTERNGFYTLAKVQTTEGITNTTTIEYSAFVVYNSSPTGDWQGDILPPYGESYVVYDSTLYDYYLVEDFSTFNETICFYDFENNQICINVESLPTLNDILIDANSSTTNQDIPQQKINYILEFLKLPIRSLRRVAEGTCEAITLPIPIIGGTIQLNCLSSLFQNVLGASFEFFRLIINGLLLYRITIHNIKVFKDVLDPSNTGIEVVNL